MQVTVDQNKILHDLGCEVPMPYIPIALQWIRIKFKLYLVIFPQPDENNTDKFIWRVYGQSHKSMYWSDLDCNSWEDAEKMGLEYLLDFLKPK